jgi:peptidoglycan/LPS O-acetylase OafA/YrhL
MRIYAGTDTRFDSILTGSFLALASAYGRKRWQGFLLGYPALAASAALLLLSLLIRDVAFRNTLRYTIQNLAIAVIVANVVFHQGSLLGKLLALRPMVYLGRLSYSLYLYHFAVVVVILRLYGAFTWQDPAFYLFFILSFLLSMASYYFVEKPMVRFRRRFGSQAGQQRAA